MAVYKTRRPTRTVHVRWGQNDVTIGGMSPVRVQSMTNTATADVEASVNQVLALSRAGSELVRLTVNTPEAARAVVRIREKLDAAGCDVPLVGDFHYNGHKLLTEVGECAQALSKYRINPGNVGKGERGMENFARMIEVALRYEKPVRIGVNGGSLDPEILAQMLEANRAKGMPETPSEVQLHAMVASALQSARQAEALGLPADRIVLSAKVSGDKGCCGKRCINGCFADRGHWRYDPSEHHADAGCGPNRRSPRRSGTFADHGSSRIFSPCGIVPRMRPHFKQPFPRIGCPHAALFG